MRVNMNNTSTTFYVNGNHQYIYYTLNNKGFSNATNKNQK